MNPAYTFSPAFPGPYRVSAELPECRSSREPHRSGAAGRDGRCELQVGQTVTQVEVQDVTPMVTTEPDPGPHPGAAANRATPGERQELSGVSGHGARHRFHRHRAGLWDANEHQHDAVRWRSGERSLGRMGFRPRSRSGRSPGNARRDQQLVGEVRPPSDGSPQQQERHEPVPRRAVRNDPQQRNRRRPPAGRTRSPKLRI